MPQLWQNNTSRTQEETAISGFVNYIKIFPSVVYASGRICLLQAGADKFVSHKNMTYRVMFYMLYWY